MNRVEEENDFKKVVLVLLISGQRSRNTRWVAFIATVLKGRRFVNCWPDNGLFEIVKIETVRVQVLMADHRRVRGTWRSWGASKVLLDTSRMCSVGGKLSYLLCSAIYVEWRETGGRTAGESRGADSNVQQKTGSPVCVCVLCAVLCVCVYTYTVYTLRRDLIVGWKRKENRNEYEWEVAGGQKIRIGPAHEVSTTAKNDQV